MRTEKWSEEKSNQWYESQPWLRGCNYTPGTAVNQLEMWQADTFDPETIDRELGWASDLGFNCMRVFLHDLVWKQDPEGFKERINSYLEISLKHGIKTMFVFFDDCWKTEPIPGKQPDPVPGLHNSGWVQSPGLEVLKHPESWGYLKDYVQDIVSTFAKDDRIVIWDVYNEPGNFFLPSMWLNPLRRAVKQYLLAAQHFLGKSPTKPLLKSVFHWIREINPDQLLTAGIWYPVPGVPSRLNRVMLEESDIIAFHDYEKIGNTRTIFTMLKSLNRPVICSEYLARTADNTFQSHLPFYKSEKIGAINWGLIAGKTQTFIAWEDKGEAEPALWFHDILRSDGSPFREEEKSFLQDINEV